MSTVKRVAPADFGEYGAKSWVIQCLQDLDAGRHAIGCPCDTYPNEDTPERDANINACTHIVRCALEMRDYTVEVRE